MVNKWLTNAPARAGPGSFRACRTFPLRLGVGSRIGPPIGQRTSGIPSPALHPADLSIWEETDQMPDKVQRTETNDIDILEQARQSLADGDAGNSDYVPSADEPYMSDVQRDYFRRLLAEWKSSIHDASSATLQSLQDAPIREADANDRASSETDWGIELRTRDRQRKLIAKIDAALRRLDDGEYGYCEKTGDPIGLARLLARPVATMTVEAQEAHERREKISREN